MLVLVWLVWIRWVGSRSLWGFRPCGVDQVDDVAVFEVGDASS